LTYFRLDDLDVGESKSVADVLQQYRKTTTMMYGDMSTTLSPVHLLRTPRNLEEDDSGLEKDSVDSGVDDVYVDSGLQRDSVDSGVDDAYVDSESAEGSIEYDLTTEDDRWGWKIEAETTTLLSR
jgi:hypothetical protein